MSRYQIKTDNHTRLVELAYLARFALDSVPGLVSLELRELENALAVGAYYGKPPARKLHGLLDALEIGSYYGGPAEALVEFIRAMARRDGLP